MADRVLFLVCVSVVFVSFLCLRKISDGSIIDLFTAAVVIVTVVVTAAIAAAAVIVVVVGGQGEREGWKKAGIEFVYE